MIGPAYGSVFKALSLVLILLATVSAWQIHTWAHGQGMQQTMVWVGAPWAMMAYTVWFVLTGKTRLSEQYIEQSWMWQKQLPMQSIAYAKVIRIKKLEWLIAPRLYTKTFGGKLVIIYAASPAMLEAFERLAKAIADRSTRP